MLLSFAATDPELPQTLAAPAAQGRGGRFVAVIECILNQNARDDGAACSPAMNVPLLQLCNTHRVGILQMPCPEIHTLGFARQRAPGLSIRDALNDEGSVKRCVSARRRGASKST